MKNYINKLLTWLECRYHFTHPRVCRYIWRFDHWYNDTKPGQLRKGQERPATELYTKTEVAEGIEWKARPTSYRRYGSFITFYER